ncbi:phosphate ABC transporter ATP-binding protein [Lentilactobacillus buchneri]|uniref:phosphate ABC transporter ATP-binding protein PstB n=1 Tax=Lentilactobacillus buchneri TaxID=1581 RepID=UPI0021A8D65D|nr:phosphate ABC transporter ATP-binding protein PstB [Lentilactobacillus buchneri]MCT3544638.1 phosphate ABC transporter ATP-binding protein [Lentilactobacillus buchneri]
MQNTTELNNKPKRFIYDFNPEENDITMQTKDLEIYYGKTLAMHNADLKFKKNTITALIGPSGSGKSTFLRALNRMNAGVATVKGEILYQGVNINQPKIDVYEVRRRIGMVFQRPNPFAKSIYDNVTFALQRRGIHDKKTLDQVVETTLKQAAVWDQVKDSLNKSALSLSGGQAQRVCIARALAVQPDVLLLDEPASALDPVSTQQLEATLRELKKDYTIIIVTHNMQQAARLSDYTVFFNMGEAIEYNKTRKVFTRPKVQMTDDYVSGNFG